MSRRAGGLAALVAALLACLAVAARARAVGFSAYDDEGYVQQTVRSALSTGGLHDRTYTSYGPTFYLYRAALHAAGLPLTHDAGRDLTFVEYAAVMVVLATLALRHSRSAWLAACLVVASATPLLRLFQEPAHPQGLALALVLGALCLVPARDAALGPRRAAALGAAVGAVALVKVNVGLFLGLGLAAPHLYARRGWPRAAGRLLLVACLLLPVALLRAHLGSPSALALALTATAGAAALVRRLWSVPPRDAPLSLGWLVAGGLAAGAASCGYALATGSTPGGLLQGVLVRPTRNPGLFYLPAPLPPPWVWPLAAAAPALALVDLRARPRLLVGLKALAAGLLLLDRPVDGAQLWLGPGLCWLLLTGRTSPARVALALTAIVGTLVVYPIAGAQLQWALLPLLAVGVALAGDVGRALPARVRPGAAVALLAALLGVHAGPLRQAFAPRAWPLNLPGARAIEVPLEQGALAGWVVANLRAHADLTFSDPGLASFSIWSGVPLPDPGRQLPSWYFWLDDAEQERQRARLDAARAPMVLRWSTNMWRVLGPDPSGRPLVRHLRDAYEPWRQRGSFELLVRKGTAAAARDELLCGPLTLEGQPDGAAPVLAGPLLERPGAVEAWWRTTSPGVVVGLVAGVPDAPPTAWLPVLYVGDDGRLRSTAGRPREAPLASPARVDDGAWHQAVVERRGGGVALYLDGARVDEGPEAGEPWPPFTAGLAGAGCSAGWPAGLAGWSCLTGALGRVAVRREPLGPDEVARRWRSGPPG